MKKIDKLNARHGIPGVVEFVNGPGGLPSVSITNTRASALATLQGAQMLSFKLADGRDLLWVSEASHFKPGAAIRGGIPICWPWFGGHPENPDLPAHGFARISEWDVVETAALGDGSTRIIFGLNDSPETRCGWDHAFDLRLSVTVSDALTVSLITKNTGFQPLEITSALHTYFSVSRINDVSVSGLDGCPCLDTLDGEEKVQSGDIRFDCETDNVYFDQTSDILLNDPGFHRTIRIGKEGSASTIVWNPWVEKAKRMADFGDNEYPSMLCIEAANALKDMRRIEPGMTHELTTTLSVLPA